MIYVSELQMTNMFLYMVLVDPQDIYKLNIYTGSFLDQDFDSHMKNVWELNNFDIIIGNPPYNQMLDLDFVQKSYKLSNIVIFVQPSTYLIDQKCKQKKFVETKKLISKHLESIKLFNGNALFKIALFVPCSITYINKDKVSTKIKCIDTVRNVNIDYDNIFDINSFSNIKEYKSILEKILSKNKISILDKMIHNINKSGNKTKIKLEKFSSHLKTENEYFINIAQIRGNVDMERMLKDDFYTIVTKDNKVSNSINGNAFWSFKSENEANNFLIYLKTYFCRFCLSILKNNSQLDRGELQYIPYLSYEKPLTDADLYSMFDITEKEQAFIKTIIPKYY